MALGAGAQPNMKGKKIGLYLSSTGLSYTNDYSMDLALFLKTGDEDRSQVPVQQLKPEFLVRFGELFVQNLQRVAGADTAIFLNADMARATAFKQRYSTETGQLAPAANADIEYILVVKKLSLSRRMANSTYIRSNVMKTERVPVYVISATVQLFSEKGKTPPQTISLNYDSYNAPKQPIVFDFNNENSPLGKALGDACSRWWRELK